MPTVTEDLVDVHPTHKKLPEEVEILDLAMVVARRRKLILGVTGSTTLMALIVSFLLPVRYTGRASLLPPQQAQSAATLMAGQLSLLTGASSRDLGLKNPNDLYLGLLRSNSVTDALVERFKLRDVYGKKLNSEARNELADRSTISIAKEGLIIVEVEDGEAGRAASLANGYAEELEHLNERLALTEAAQRRLFYEGQMASVKERLQRAERDLADTERQTGIIHVEGQAQALAEQAAVVRGQIAAKQVQAQAMRTFATEQNPDYKLLQQEIAGLQAQLANVERGVGEGATGSTARLSAGSLEYLRKLREVRYQETLFELIAKQLEAARLDEAHDSVPVQVVDRATPPEHRSSPKRFWIVFSALFLSGMFATLGVLIEAVVKRSIAQPGRKEKFEEVLETLRGKGQS